MHIEAGLTEVTDISQMMPDNSLTHCGLMTPYGEIDLGKHWLR